jgi:hypothetical protein
MPTLPNLALPYPDSSAVPDVPGDLFKLAKAVDDKGGQTTVGHAGTVVDYGSGYVSQVTRSGNIVTLTININPGANGLSASSGNNLACSVPVGMRPSTPITFHVDVNSGGSWSGGWATFGVDPDGTVHYRNSTLSLVSGHLISGSVSYRAA